MDRTLTIREAQQSDAAALSELAVTTYAAAFGHTFSEADLAAHLQKNLSSESFSRSLNNDAILLAEVGGRLIGYAQFGAANVDGARDGDQEIRRLYVHPEFQN